MKHQKSRRSGFSLIELLVSVSIIAVLMSLLLPAIQSARESSRRIQCANRLRNLSLAISNWTAARQRFPAAGYWGGGPEPDPIDPQPHHNWVVEILPWIDRSDLADRWDDTQLVTHETNQELASTLIETLVCPSDYTVTGSGDLSFALNGGVGESMYADGVHDTITDPFFYPLDLNGNGITGALKEPVTDTPTDRELYFRLSLFFSESYGFSKSKHGFSGTHRFHRPATVTDGMSNTLMMGENVRVGSDPRDPLSNWAAPDGRRSKLYFNHQICADNSCKEGNIDVSVANGGGHGINERRFGAEGWSPWLSSFHNGGVNVAMCDGRVQFLSEDVDSRVYFNMFTPQGYSLRYQPLDFGITGDSF